MRKSFMDTMSDTLLVSAAIMAVVLCAATVGATIYVVLTFAGQVLP